MDKASKIVRKSIEQWLMSSVADDEFYNDLTIDDVDDSYIPDDEFKVLMDVFPKLIYKAVRKSNKMGMIKKEWYSFFLFSYFEY